MSESQPGIEGWYDIKWKDIKTRNDWDMWLWNRITDSYWLEIISAIGIILIILSGGPKG